MILALEEPLVTAAASPPDAPPQEHAAQQSDRRREKAAASLRRRADQLFARPIEFIGAGRHVTPGVGEAEFDGVAFLDSLDESSWLDADQEAVLFGRMNGLKRRAAELLSSFDRQRPEPALVGKIESLLSAAEHIRNQLIRVFFKLSVSIARSFAASDHSLDEMVSEANITLLRAVEKFNVDYGFRFSTYATHAIRRGLCRYLKRSRQEVSRTTALPPGDVVADCRKWTLSREQQFAGVLVRLNSVIGNLNDRDRKIVLSRYGLGDELQPQTLQQLADRFGVSRERIRQLEFRALHKLRSMAGSDGVCSLEA